MNGVITFLDILGWKGIYNRDENPIAKLKELYQDINLKMADENRRRGRRMTYGARSVSDTIILFTRLEEEASEEDVSNALLDQGKVCATGIVQSIVSGIPLRGATAYGNFEFDDKKNIYVGKTVDEAAMWYETGDWIGVHLTPSAMFAIEPEDLSPSWMPYFLPTTQKVRLETLCVNWLDTWKHSINDDERLRQLRQLFLQMGPIVPSLSGKFTNTLAFLRKLNEAMAGT